MGKDILEEFFFFFWFSTEGLFKKCISFHIFICMLARFLKDQHFRLHQKDFFLNVITDDCFQIFKSLIMTN